MPMPNMITPSRMLVRDIVPTFTLVKGRNTPGRNSPTPAKRMVSHAMYLPARSLNLFKNFTRFFLFSLLCPLGFIKFFVKGAVPTVHCGNKRVRR